MSNFELKPEESRALQELAAVVAEESGVVLSTLLDKKIDIGVKHSGQADRGPLEGRYPGELVQVQCAFATGFDETLLFLFTKEIVARLSDLMMMGDGTAEFSEDHIDAIQEGVNQMMGAAATALSSKLGRTVDFQPSSARVTTLEEIGAALDDQALISLELQIEGQSGGMIEILAASALVRAMAGAMSGGARPQPGGLAEDEFDMAAAALGSEPSLGAGDLGMLGEAFSGGESGGGRQAMLELGQFNNKERERLELLLDLKLDISIELGRTRMLVRDILELGPGAVVELDKMAGETVDLLVNDKKLAEGEVVVVDENFGIRITHLISMEERIKMLQAG